MSLNFSRRTLAAVGVAVTAVLGGGLAASVLPAADAQTSPSTSIGILTNFPVFASNGFTSLPEFSGTADGVRGAACTGAAPTSGGNIPAQVVTNLGSQLTNMRILHNDGTPLTGSVRVNCVLEVTATPAGQATLRRIQQLSG
jgi:hypothetical protein